MQRATCQQLVDAVRNFEPTSEPGFSIKQYPDLVNKDGERSLFIDPKAPFEYHQTDFGPFKLSNIWFGEIELALGDKRMKELNADETDFIVVVRKPGQVSID